MHTMNVTGVGGIQSGHNVDVDASASNPPPMLMVLHAAVGRLICRFKVLPRNDRVDPPKKM